MLREVESAGCHDLVFYHILYFFYGYSASDLVAFIFDVVCNIVNLFRRKSGSFLRVVGLCNGRHNFFGIESGFRAVPLDDFHSLPLLFRAKIPENRSK